MCRLAAVLLTLLVPALGAQTIRGVVHDSSSGIPVPGAVVIILDSARVLVTRTVTNGRGEYDLPRAPEARIIRTMRLGFRPRELNIPPSAAPIQHLDVGIIAIPVTLQTVRTLAAAACPKRKDGAAALALLEQIRSGLLSMIVARETKPAVIVRLATRKKRHFSTDSIMMMSVMMDSAETTNSYMAALSARDFIETGFAKDSAGIFTAYGPDAEVLIDEAFANAYCFRLMDPMPARPRQIGLGFMPAERRMGRIDIDGALWVDTSAKSLVDIEFLYRGFDRTFDPAHPGGHVEFRNMPNGVTMIDRWVLRLPDTESRANTGRRSAFRLDNTVMRESGGEIARVRWADSTSWSASLGTAHLLLGTRSGVPDSGRVVRLDSTSYVGRADSAGWIEFRELAPGPYKVSLVDGRLIQIGVKINTEGSFEAVRDSLTTLRVVTPTAEQFMQDVCTNDRLEVGGAMIIGRVNETDGTPASRVEFTIDHLVEGQGITRIAEGGHTGSDGLFKWCDIGKDWHVIITAKRGNVTRAIDLPTVPRGLTVLQFKLQPEP